jgi:hypothetical protein
LGQMCDYSTCMGHVARVGSSYATAVGYAARASGTGSIAFGQADATGAQCIAIGNFANCRGNTCVCVGADSSILGSEITGSVIIGPRCSTNKSSNVIVGSNVYCLTGSQNVVVGGFTDGGAFSLNNTDNAVVIGKVTSAGGNQSCVVAVGTDIRLTGANGVSLSGCTGGVVDSVPNGFVVRPVNPITGGSTAGWGPLYYNPTTFEVRYLP